MASGDTDVSICSQALLLLGANEITSFSDGTAPSAICSKLYPRVKSQTLGMYPWSFTLKKTQLGQLASTPTNVYSKEYQMIYQMAWHLAEPVTDQTTKSDYWKTVALGTPSENMRGGYFRQAINIDGAGQSKTVIADYLLTEVR